MDAKEVWDRLKRDAFSRASPATIDPAAAREVIAEALTEALSAQAAEVERLKKALERAQAHLEYCGYGDQWERECAEAEGLAELIAEAAAKAFRDNPPMFRPRLDT